MKKLINRPRANNGIELTAQKLATVDAERKAVFEHTMSKNSDPIDIAIRQLCLRRRYLHGDRLIEIAVLIRSIDWRPLRVHWWHGKEVCIIGADLDGNFLLRHCDGSVRYWDHRSSTDTIVAPSVKAFVGGIIE
jgi:hypothetical protein